jgi:hypothetical protein
MLGLCRESHLHYTVRSCKGKFFAQDDESRLHLSPSRNQTSAPQILKSSQVERLTADVCQARFPDDRGQT